MRTVTGAHSTNIMNRTKPSPGDDRDSPDSGGSEERWIDGDRTPPLRRLFDDGGPPRTPSGHDWVRRPSLSPQLSRRSDDDVPLMLFDPSARMPPLRGSLSGRYADVVSPNLSGLALLIDEAADTAASGRIATMWSPSSSMSLCGDTVSSHVDTPPVSNVAEQLHPGRYRTERATHPTPTRIAGGHIPWPARPPVPGTHEPWANDVARQFHPLPGGPAKPVVRCKDRRSSTQSPEAPRDTGGVPPGVRHIGTIRGGVLPPPSEDHPPGADATARVRHSNTKLLTD